MPTTRTRVEQVTLQNEICGHCGNKRRGVPSAVAYALCIECGQYAHWLGTKWCWPCKGKP